MTGRTTRIRKLVAVTAGTAVAVLGVGACDDDDDPIEGVPPLENETPTDPTGGEDTSPPAEDSELAEITIVDFAFTGATAAPGATVPIRNDGSATHTVTADNDEFDAGRIEPGGTAEITAPSEPGSYAFHCEIHSTMEGTLTVA